MNGFKRTLTTLAGAAVTGALIWFVPHFSRWTTGGYWAGMTFIALAGMLLGVAQLRGRDGNGTGMFLLGFLPVLVAAGWVLLATQPGDGWIRDHVVSWSASLGIGHAVHNLGERVAVLAFGLGLVFGLTFEPAMIRRRRRSPAAAVTPIETTGPPVEARVVPGEPTIVADQPTLIADQPTLIADQPTLAADEPTHRRPAHDRRRARRSHRAHGAERGGAARSALRRSKPAGSVTGARQAKRSQTYTAGSPPTSVLPARRGISSAGPNATTACGSQCASAARATSERRGPTIAISLRGER